MMETKRMVGKKRLDNDNTGSLEIAIQQFLSTLTYTLPSGAGKEGSEEKEAGR